MNADRTSGIKSVSLHAPELFLGKGTPAFFVAKTLPEAVPKKAAGTRRERSLTAIGSISVHLRSSAAKSDGLSEAEEPDAAEQR